MRPPGLGSIVEPAPHHAAHCGVSVKNWKTVSRLRLDHQRAIQTMSEGNRSHRFLLPCEEQ
jgi:hypothetical protein